VECGLNEQSTLICMIEVVAAQVMRVFQNSVTQRDVTLLLVKRVRQLRLWPSGVVEKNRSIFVCLWSATRSRKQRCVVCGCVKSTQHFCCVTLRCVSERWKTRISRPLQCRCALWNMTKISAIELPAGYLRPGLNGVNGAVTLRLSHRMSDVLAACDVIIDTECVKRLYRGLEGKHPGGRERCYGESGTHGVMSL